MNKIFTTPFFDTYRKRYSKKYKSLNDDLICLEKELNDNPQKGISLGDNLYKIRLAVKSKNKGKSGGFRVITYLIKENNNDFDIYLLAIYDKSEISDILKNDLLKIVLNIFK